MDPMKEESPLDKPAAAATTAFDDYAAQPIENHSDRRKLVRSRRLCAVLRTLSGIAFVLAVIGACMVIALDCLHSVGGALVPWRLKSAFPLICVGISYGCLQFTLPRSRSELVLSLAVGLAFVLWGVEQFVPDRELASLIDDLVVFLFVLDLSIVIRGHLRSSDSK